VGVSERDSVAIQQPEVEPEDNLAIAVPPRLVGPAHGLEALPLDILGHQHTPGREARMDTGHADEGMSPQQPLDAALVLRLELVVELLSDPFAHLRGERLRVQPRGEPLDER
jgi:hypothetical protein